MVRSFSSGCFNFGQQLFVDSLATELNWKKNKIVLEKNIM